MALVAPSILSADFADLADEVKRITEAGADYVHLDIMDGHFVPNLTFGPMVVKALRPHSSLPFDAHLMVEEPERLISAFVAAGSDIITVHVESSHHLHRVITMIKDAGVRAGIALNPATSLSSLENILAEVDLVLLMSVNPGFGGQTFINSSLNKLSGLQRMKQQGHYDFKIEVDGGVNEHTGMELVQRGADILVAGSYIFNGSDLRQAVQSLKKL